MPKCLNCGERSFRRLRDYIYKSDSFRRIYTDGGVYECSCGLIQADAEQIDNDSLTRYYQTAYRSEAKITSNSSQASKAHYTARAQALLHAAKSEVKRTPSRIFEVGAGYGYNLQAFGQAYPSAELLTDELDVELQGTMGARSGKLDDGPYDVIIMSHVLEHFLNPRAILEKVAANLKQGGVLVIEVPNDYDGISVITPCDEPHIGFFSRDTLIRTLAAAQGLQVKSMFTAGPNKPATIKRRRVTSLLSRIPFALQLARRVRARYAGRDAGADYTTPVRDGLFLRVVAVRG